MGLHWRESLHQTLLGQQEKVIGRAFSARASSSMRGQWIREDSKLLGNWSWPMSVKGKSKIILIWLLSMKGQGRAGTQKSPFHLPPVNPRLHVLTPWTFVWWPLCSPSSRAIPVPCLAAPAPHLSACAIPHHDLGLISMFTPPVWPALYHPASEFLSLIDMGSYPDASLCDLGWVTELPSSFVPPLLKW